MSDYKKVRNHLLYSIDVGVLIQALLLGVMGWVGWNINEIKDDMASLSAYSQVNNNDIQRNKEELHNLRQLLRDHTRKKAHNENISNSRI